MQAAALFIYLANTSIYSFPPIVRTPIIQTATYPLTRGSTFTTMSAPDCTFNPQVPEGVLTVSDSDVSTVCRSISDMETINQTFFMQEYAFSSVFNQWTSRQRINSIPLPPIFDSALLKYVTKGAGESWILQRTPGGNFGSVISMLYKQPALPPVIISDSSKGLTFMDIQLTQNGLYAHVRRGSASGSTGLLESGIVFWSSQNLPTRPTDSFTWLPGTNSSRMWNAFLIPNSISVNSALYLNPNLLPVTVEEWRLSLTTNTWSRFSTINAPSQPAPLLQMVNIPTGILLVGQKTLSVLSASPGGGWTESLITQIPTTTQLSYRSAISGFITVYSPTPTASPLASITSTASSSPTSTVTPSTSNTPEATPTPSVTMGITPTATP
jgi:hypothetical protein